MPSPNPYIIDSLGKMIDGGYKIALYCENTREGLTCGFVKWLDLEKLAGRLGRDHGCLHDDLVPHLWCTKCGGHKVSLRSHSPTPGISKADPISTETFKPRTE